MKNAWKHFLLISKHRWEVFKLCVRAGIPFRGLVHDLSKYSPTEFLESIKYYNGYTSPINLARKEQGYSLSFIHHTTLNKHHAEYWYDILADKKAPVIPYKYMAEMICDKIAAGKIYSGKDFNLSEPLEFFLKCKDKLYMNDKVYDYTVNILTEVSKYGIKKTINPKNLKEKYKKICK